jgi:hypothetical protein
MVHHNTFPNTKNGLSQPNWNWPAAALTPPLDKACSLYSYYLTNTKNKLINNLPILILNILALRTKYISKVLRIFLLMKVTIQI